MEIRAIRTVPKMSGNHDSTMEQSGYRSNYCVHEILLTSDSTAQAANICVWDPNTGSQLAAFKGGITACNTLCYNVGRTFLLSAHPSKPLLNVWQLDRREQRPQKQTTPGKPLQALAASGTITNNVPRSSRRFRRRMQ